MAQTPRTRRKQRRVVSTTAARKGGRRKAVRQRPISFLPTENERVLALDTSSKCVGWSVFDNGQLTQHGRYVQHGTGHGERLATFRGWLLGLLTEFLPTHLIYEAPYRGLNGNTFGVLSRYAGVVESCHFEHFRAEMPIEDAVPAKVVKRAIGAPKVLRPKRKRGVRSMDVHTQNKIVVLNLVNERFGLGLKFKANDDGKKVTQDDEADAIALNWAWHILYRSPQESVPDE